MKEKWKDIKLYEGLYQISSFGRVKSLNRITSNVDGIFRELKEKILKQSISNEYYSITLNKLGIKKRFTVHRFVALAFIPNPENKEQVNHKDGNKLNNMKSNLEWNTKSENQLHAYAIGLQKRKPLT